ncbi:MAG: polysaccharide biosynthesis protein [Bacteroidales bacterium]|nr:polysaccharide biosynthesis protein [Bacteroidales bacterium]
MIKVEYTFRNRLIELLGKVRNLAEKKNSPRWIIFSLDLITTVVSVVVAWLLRFGFEVEVFRAKTFLFTLLAVLLVRVTFFFTFKIYAHVIRYTSVHDIRRIFLNVGSGSLILLGMSLVSRQILTFPTIPYSVIITEFFITLYLMSNLRIITKYIYIILSNFDNDNEPTLIIGSKDLAAVVKEALEFSDKANFKTIAYVDSRSIRKYRLGGLQIHSFKDVENLIEKHRISHVVFAKKDIIKEEKEYIARICKKYKVKMLSAPDIWLTGSIDVNDIREVNMEELLQRDPIQLGKKHIKEALRNKTVMITGAAGSIGSELVRQIAQYNPSNLILVDQAETPLYEVELELSEGLKFFNYNIVLADILNKNRLRMVFETFKPDYVYHAAAYKHVPMMENNPVEAFMNNVYGSRILADLSHEYGVKKFVMVSTDKAVNPTGIMGATKRIAEMYIQYLNSKSNTNFITTRFGNVLNSNGSVIPRFLKQIKEGGPVTVTHPEITRFFMTIPEACQLVLEASVMGNGGEIYLFDMGKAVKILDLAKNLIKSTGYRVDKDIKIEFTGLRPGEKLYEELLLEAEANKPTHHPQIMIAEVCHKSYKNIKQQLDTVEPYIKKQNIDQVVKIMKEIVPTYKSKNSTFAKLDIAG